MNIDIVTPKPEDAQGIIEVFRKAWLETYPNIEIGITREDILALSLFHEDAVTKLEDKLKSIPDKQINRIAKDGNLIIGTITLIENEDSNQLRTIYILPEYQGKGVGTLLWGAVKDYINPDKKTIVEVADYNEQAIGFYKKLGFVDTGERWTKEKWKMKSGNFIPEMRLILK